MTNDKNLGRELQDEMKGLKSNMARSNREISRMGNTVASLSKECDDLRRVVRAQDSEINQLRKEQKKLRNSLAGLFKQHEQLLQLLKRTQ